MFWVRGSRFRPQGFIYRLGAYNYGFGGMGFRAGGFRVGEFRVYGSDTAICPKAS